MNQYSRYLPLKSTIENLFGSKAWYELKTSNHLPTWKKYLIKVIKSISLSINESIETYDVDWKNEIAEVVLRGENLINETSDIEEAIAHLAATFIELSFFQVGFMPRRKGQGQTKDVTLTKNNWKLDAYRSVIYLQNVEQRENSFLSKQQKEIGFKSQIELINEHKRSNSELCYSEWSLNNDKNN